MRTIVLSLVFLIASSIAALAANRLALVIGNDAYTEVPALRTAVNDADAIAEALGAQGFGVVRATDATRREMNRAISEFVARLQPGDTALFFYAGHGVEIGGENFLLPTDIVAPASGDGAFVASESIGLSVLLDRIRATGARTTLAVVDACRENPFQAGTGRSIGGTRGLARVANPEGSFVIFSAGAGQLALDRLSETDPNPNSVFTRTLLPRLSTPGLELRDLVSQVRLEVRDLALTQNHAQFPAYYDELLGAFYLVPPAAGQDPARRVTPQVPGDAMRRDFDLAREIGTAAALTAFVERHAGSGDAFMLDIAREMLAAMDAPVEQAAAPQRIVAPSPSPSPTPDPTPAPDTPAEAPATPAGLDTRTLVRQAQEELNRLGCNAGIADGIAGPRTRAAFAQFLRDGNVGGLAESALGTEAAVTSLRSREGRICVEVAAVAPARTTPPAPATPAAPAAPSLAGTWNYSAKCPLFIRVTGSVRFRQTGEGRFSGSIADSIGQSGTVTATQVGRTVQGSINWGHVVERWSGTMAADGKSYSASASSGCTSTARR